MLRKSIVIPLVTALAIMTRPAVAEEPVLEAQYARFVGSEASKSNGLQGYELPQGMYYTHMIVGQSQQSVPQLVLLRCVDAQCEGAQYSQGPIGATVESILLVDLAGQATTLTSQRPAVTSRYGEGYMKLSWHNRRHAARPKRKKSAPVSAPAIVIQTLHRQKNGDEHGDLAILNIESNSPVTMFTGPTLDTGAGGGGTRTTYGLVRSRARALLDLGASSIELLRSRSHCLPTAVKYSFTLDAGRYVLQGEPPVMTGC
jgi:hypothetical protein